MTWELAISDVLGLITIVVVTVIHAHKFAANEQIGPLFHVVWGAIYGGVVAGCYLFFKDAWIIALMSAERFALYNIILNGLRGRKFFYMGSSKYASWWDDIELLWCKIYPYAWGLGAGIYVTLHFIAK